MKLTNQGLVEYVKKIEKKYKTIYMWGSFGQKVTDSFVTQKANQYPQWYTASRVNKFKGLVNKGVYAFDCVGLIKSYVWGGIDNHKYTVAQDKSADGMYRAAKVKGNISTLPEIPGVLVWMSGHIGVYIGNGEVIECSPKWKDGVQKTKLSQRKWQGWCECPYIEYVEERIEEKEVKEVKQEVVQVVRYNTIEEIPSWGKETVEKLINKGFLQGSSKGLGLDLSYEILRVLVITDRAGLYD